jgi:hypothetical protein
MKKVHIKEKELKILKRQANAYKKLATHIFESVIKDPVQIVVEDFKKTGLYSAKFLSDMEDGLKRSSYSK